MQLPQNMFALVSVGMSTVYRTHLDPVQEDPTLLLMVRLCTGALYTQVVQGGCQRVVFVCEPPKKSSTELTLLHVPRRSDAALQIHDGLARKQSLRDLRTRPRLSVIHLFRRHYVRVTSGARSPSDVLFCG